MLKCYILTSRYIFDLHTLLVEICPNEDEIYISKRKQRKYENGENEKKKKEKASRRTFRLFLLK